MEAESIKLDVTYLDKIAAKIGTTAEQVWPWLIRQQYVEAIYPLVIFAVFCAVLIPVLMFVVRHWRPDSGYSICSSDHEVVWGFSCIALAIGACISLAVFLGEFGDLFNPEYQAFMRLLSLGK